MLPGRGLSRISYLALYHPNLIQEKQESTTYYIFLRTSHDILVACLLTYPIPPPDRLVTCFLASCQFLLLSLLANGLIAPWWLQSPSHPLLQKKNPKGPLSHELRYPFRDFPENKSPSGSEQTPPKVTVSLQKTLLGAEHLYTAIQNVSLPCKQVYFIFSCSCF